MYAIEYDNKALFDILLKAKASVNVQDSYGYTPLIYAVRYNKKEIVEALLDAKADVNAKDKNGIDALSAACEGRKEHADLVAFLIMKRGSKDKNTEREREKMEKIYAKFKGVSGILPIQT